MSLKQKRGKRPPGALLANFPEWACLCGLMSGRVLALQASYLNEGM